MLSVVVCIFIYGTIMFTFMGVLLFVEFFLCMRVPCFSNSFCYFDCQCISSFVRRCLLCTVPF